MWMNAIKFVNILAFGILLLSSGASLAQDVNDNPYVTLYRKRVDVSRSAVESQRKTIEFERTKWLRYEELARIGAVSRKEANAQRTVYRVAEKDLEINKLELSDSEALLQIAISRVEAGLDMEVCPIEHD